MAAKAVAVLVQLITIPLTLRYLGAERYGMWMVVSTFTTMLSFADFGIGNGLLNAVAVAYGRDDTLAIRRAVSGSYAMLIGLGATFLALFAIVHVHIDWAAFFNVQSPLARSEARPVIAVLAVCTALSLPAVLASRLQTGTQRGYLASGWMGLGYALSLPAIVAAIRLHAGLPTLVAVFLGAPLLANLANTVLFFGYLAPELRPASGIVAWAEMAGSARQALLFVAIQIGNCVTSASVPMVIAQVAGPQAVAQYAVPERLLALVVMLVSMAVQPLWPAWREALARGDGRWVMQTYRRTLLRVAGLALPALIVLGLAMPWIIRVWAHNAVTPSALLVCGLCLYKACECLLWVNAMCLNAMAQLALQAVMALANALLFVMFAIVSCHVCGPGGIAWAGLVPLIAASLVPGSLAIRRQFKTLP